NQAEKGTAMWGVAERGRPGPPPAGYRSQANTQRGHRYSGTPAAMRCSNVARFFSHTFSTSAVRQPAEARMSEARQEAPLLRTPLYKFHLERAARLLALAGYEMPVQYPTGILTEHLHTRAAAGLFDISHMGQIAMRSMVGRLEDAARALETLVPTDVIGIGEGRQRYALFTNAAGGILDD